MHYFYSPVKYLPPDSSGRRQFLRGYMRIYIGFDDTDTYEADRGTGKLARWFEDTLPPRYTVWGVVRQQLLVHDAIPYTSHNSSACVVVNAPDISCKDDLIRRAVAHIETYSLPGSDPGICVACENEGVLPELIEVGFQCTARILHQKDVVKLSPEIHISGHGGTNDGIIGATAAVGLTASGWCGRFIEYGRLRSYADSIKISELERDGITVTSIDRNARVPSSRDMVISHGWLRPRLLGNRPVIMVTPRDEGIWESLGRKNKAGHGEKITGTLTGLPREAPRIL
jgi:hypothetical protein